MNYITAQLNKKNSTKGFTLIELMVVIAVIAILAVVGSVVYTGVQQRARDSKRVSDITAIAKALEAKKSQTVATYATVAATDFSDGIPVDSTTAKYCLAESSSKTLPAVITAWTSADACPTAPAATYTVFSGTIAATTQSWRICTLLEVTSTPQWSCKTSIQ